MGFARGEVPQTHWATSGGGKQHVEGSFFTNDMFLLLDAAVRGQGIAVLPLLLFRAPAGARLRRRRGGLGPWHPGCTCP
jgi:DNA-binding transcriptional LysR family regulator